MKFNGFNTTAAAELGRLIAQLQLAKWNALIPKCARQVHEDGAAVKYLHPTKGWRWVHKRRLGMPL